ncbi:MAG: hypothetical protein LBT79_07425 [Elusimicrobiota bacterium]|jgi:hypothetical protein|nr:hypothetical protein [Elusimicrobiota bacterium]
MSKPEKDTRKEQPQKQSVRLEHLKAEAIKGLSIDKNYKIILTAKISEVARSEWDEQPNNCLVRAIIDDVRIEPIDSKMEKIKSSKTIEELEKNAKGD